MPLVFVHGVNVRSGKGYEKELMQRNQYFCNIFYRLLGRQIGAEEILSPYWGDLATSLTTGSPFLPQNKTKTAPGKSDKNKKQDQEEEQDQDHESDQDLEPEEGNEGSLLDLARTGSIEQVLDVVIATASEQAEHSSQQASELSKLAFRALELNRQIEDAAGWLEGIQSDEQLLQKLETEVQGLATNSDKPSSGVNHFRVATEWLKQNYGSAQAAKKRLGLKKQQVDSGIHSLVERAQTRVKQVKAVRRSVTSHIAAAAFTGPVRKLFHERLFLFIGDSFLYFGQRGTERAPGPIVQRVCTALDEASAKRTKSDPLIVVAHSMGGNIMSDIVSYFRPDQEIDILITVASQFPLFADLHMFPGLDTRSRPISKPANVKRWINFFDVNDVFGFTAHPMFTGIEDIDFASGRLGIATHADCFKFISLYERMAEIVGN